MIKYNGLPGEESNDQFEGRHRYIINLGSPILEQTIDEIESQTGSQLAYSVLRDWICLDAANIARKRVGREALKAPKKWKTNIAPLTDREFEMTWVYFWANGGSEVVQKDLAPILMALGVSYGKENKTAELAALQAFMGSVRKWLSPGELELLDANFEERSRTISRS
jgi:hypothetical protein